jgi:Zn-dependent protease with chaperone function
MNVQVSNNFKKMTGKAIFSIIMFVVVYVLLLSLAIGLTALCAYMGIMLVIAWPRLIGFALGIGLASLGFFILIFLFKFLFKRHKTDRSHLVEITRDQEPELFKFIEDIVNEVQTTFPKRIYLSADVNACVFYDSSFWSMFFPIRKNLQIGVGLVNTISKQEFKAILAHEFGHFSQRSMKVGSYVYNVNQVIFNMLFDNESFDGMIQKWANVSGYFSIFVVMAVHIINGIQTILKKMYDLININYMALSREMEFHADEVAANVAGYIPLKESLLRMELADHSYNSVLGFYNNKITENVKSRNIFREQQFVMNFLATENELPFKNNLPLVSAIDLNKYNKSRLNIKNQWASHPSVEERISALEKLNIIKDVPDEQAAISLFSKPGTTEETLTEKVFSTVSFLEKTTELEVAFFEKEYMETHYKNSFHKLYNGYYDHKNPNEFDLENIDNKSTGIPLDELFSKEKADMIYEHIALVTDKDTLSRIVSKEYQIKTYDYDGQKYSARDAENLISRLDKEIAILNDKITENDKNIYLCFFNLAKINGNEQALKQQYQEFFEAGKAFDRNMELFNDLLQATQFIQQVTSVEEIEVKLDNLKTLENQLKEELRILLNIEKLKVEIPAPMKENFEKYLSTTWTYFEGQSYNEDILQILFAAIHEFHFILSTHYFVIKRDLLNFQVAQLAK